MKGGHHTEAGPASLRTLIYDDEGERPSLQVLDQLLVPDEKKYIDILDVQGAWTVIRNMNIRGAPLIAIVAILGLAVDLKSGKTSKELDELVSKNGSDCYEAIYTVVDEKMKHLNTSRPTAVNLSNALQEMREELAKLKGDSSKPSREAIVDSVVKFARFMLDRDGNDNMKLAGHGADAILEKKKGVGKVTIMTICNTGALATSHYGTALGVVRALRDRNQLGKVVALETRPYNQGARLTAFEIVEEKMPGGTLICDCMAASFMDQESVDAVVIGADRVCANGDTANKIGSYTLALSAAAHDVPFYVASPFTTLDVSTEKGSDIVIEQRPAAELLESARAPKSIAVWNPSFDVTPAKYISGIVTEKGIIYPDKDGKFDVPAFVKANSKDGPETKKQRTE
mmetsp:Transcript_20499/g.56577  ORF Transcript_20499/g.56577 Transcript_20499/m.56577 type:complete len:399 (-) Transcript_20499:158-1354(-)